MTDSDMLTTAFTIATEIATTITVENVTTWENSTDDPVFPPPKFGGIPSREITLETWLVPLILGLVTLIGIVGNSVVIFVVFKNGKMHTVTNFYIVNLAVTDISFLFFVVPFTASLYATHYGTWIWGRFMCKFVNYMQLVTAQATCLTLTAMSVDRYQAIVHPLKSLRTRTTRVAAITSTSIWTFSILVSLPLMVYYDLITFGPLAFCVMKWPLNAYIMKTVYVIYLFVVIYAIPIIIITICYANMLRRLWMQVVPDAATNAQAQERHARQKRKITYMVLVVVIVFIVCWMPFHIVNAWTRIGTTYPSRTTAGFAFQVFVRVLAYSNSCLNPFVYAFMGENFRKYFKKACPCCYPKNKVGPDLSSGEGRSVVHERTAGGTLHSNVPP